MAPTNGVISFTTIVFPTGSEAVSVVGISEAFSSTNNNAFCDLMVCDTVSHFISAIFLEKRILQNYIKIDAKFSHEYRLAKTSINNALRYSLTCGITFARSFVTAFDE